MSAKARHGVGKSGPLDARAIATAVLPLEEDRLRRPRADDGARQALRVLVAARDQMAHEKTMTSTRSPHSCEPTTLASTLVSP
jgi:transposase